MSSFSSIQRQLSSLAARKRQREQLLEDVRSGKYDHVLPASEYYGATGEPVESAPPEPAEAVAAGLEEFQERDGGVLHRRVVLEAPSGGTGVVVGKGPVASGPARPSPDPEPGTGSPYLPIRPYRLDGWREFPEPVLRELLTPADRKDAGEIGIEDVCFLDTETSGLAGGTGTVAFLTGLGWWERGPSGCWQFVVEQYLMRDFPHEPAMVVLLEERLRRFRCFCTYNGRTFDIPLLRTRAIMNRCRPGPYRLPNIDLLPFCRRFWRGVLPSVSLKQVELDVLGLDRGPDIDGALIPRIFFELSQGERPRLLPAVLSHNVQDIATLGGLLEKALRIAADPFGGGELSRWAEYAALARYCERRRDQPAAARALGLALKAAPGNGEEKGLSLRLAAARKRLREWEQAVELWRGLAGDRDWALAVCAATELAKYYEHVAKDFAAALQVVEGVKRRGELLVELGSYIGTGGTDGVAVEGLLADLSRRENRLRRRLRTKTRKPEPR